ncbi:ShlB/FhaC/HecB family hemolysin secretion/activation protein [Agrobacterium sp. 22094]|uniref:ShlB/FhaC/HecB family hemolysin secretion/activation protein n=1 Tax=Agrobacterium sp. 22094 TaxID=3453872 RepID=UPI003F825687
MLSIAVPFDFKRLRIRSFSQVKAHSVDGFTATIHVLRVTGAASILTGILSVLPATAQSPSEDFFRRREQQQQFQRIEELKQSTPSGNSGQSRAAGAEPNAGGACFNISAVKIEGAMKLSAFSLQQITRGYEHRCIGVGDITALLKAVTDLYLDKGFVTSRAYVPPQDIAGTRLLRLVVVEGTISDIYINGKRTEGSASLATAFPGVKGDVANIRDIEQGLEQINRLHSNDAKTSMLPGNDDGTSILNVENKPGRRWNVSLSNSNLGQETTGYSQTNVTLGFDDVVGLNDLWGFSYGRTGPDYPWGGDGLGHSSSYSVNASVPYGYWTYSANGSWYTYDSSIPGNFGAINTSGDSGQIGFNVDRVVLRDKDSITTLRGGFSYKQTNNFLLGSRIEVGSRRYTIGTLGLSRSQRALGGVIALDFAVDQGLDVFGAVDAGAPAAGTADPRFTRFTTTSSISRPFEAAGHQFEVTTLLNAQYSPDNMFGGEQMGLGGSSNVRGLREGVIFGNNGFFNRNELVWRTTPWEGTSAAPILGELRPYVGLDYGHVFSQQRFDISAGDLASWTVGARLVGGTLSADVGYSQVFSSSVSNGRGHLFFASVTARW